MTTEITAIVRELNVLMRESVTHWPVEPIYVCRSCRGDIPTHRDTCIVTRIVALLEAK
jgi:hypothetical protein